MNWPQTAQKDGVTYTIDRPTFGSLLGTQIRLEAPLQVTTADGSQQSGQVEISATIAPADQHGEVEINRFEVIKATIGGADDTGPVRTALNTLLQNAGLTVDRRALAAKLQVDPVSTPGLKHQPPVIKVVERPTVLLSVDGDPRTVPMGTTGWRRATNTPFILIVDPNSNWYLRLGQNDWRGAYSFRGPWQKASPPPDAVIAALGKPPALPPDVARDQAAADQSRAATQNTQTQPPDVLVATVPTVLISLNGPAQLAPVCPGVQGATNTDGILLFTDNPGRYWTLASGRWFSAPTEDGPWGYIPPTQVPAAFAQLPETGQYAPALASVPNTPAAKEAVLASAEMRTVTLDRTSAKCAVSYQGKPKFAAIEGTQLSYAVNASQPVIQDGATYYCCDNAAWFSSSAPDSGWTLCDKVPDAVYDIPASCPVYACTYVEVAGSTSDSVTFGFTPGYLGTYMQDGTPVYGTGYSYQSADLGNGNTQTYPQTYGSDPGYDDDTGTFAPPTGDTYIYEYPAVQPYYYDTGYCGWGWCGGWSNCWAGGWGNWGYWHHWNNWWNHWNPYDHHWNNAWNQWQRDQNQARQNRLAAADRGRNGTNGWGAATRTPGGQRPTNTPGGERPTNTPGGERPTNTPGGERPTNTPGGERPTRTPGGEIPTRNPGGERPTNNPGGERPTRTPGGQVPTRYPTQRSYGGNYGNYSGFHPAYHQQAGAYGGGYRAPVRSGGGGGGARGGGGRR